MPPEALLQGLAALNPAAATSNATQVVRDIVLFSYFAAAPVRSRFVGTAVHAHGIRARPRRLIPPGRKVPVIPNDAAPSVSDLHFLAIDEASCLIDRRQISRVALI
jgi:hypothetical protein